MQFLHRNGGPASLGRQSENSDASGATARVRIVPPRGERWQLSVVTLRRPVVSSEVGRRCPSAQNCRPKFCSEHGAATGHGWAVGLGFPPVVSAPSLPACKLYCGAPHASNMHEDLAKVSRHRAPGLARSGDNTVAHHGVQLCPMSGKRSEQETRLELATLTG
jgi:hypothetical protein